MGAFSDFAEANPHLFAEAPPEAAPSFGGELGKGINRGLRIGGSQLESLAGLGGEAVGANNFAANRRADATSLRAQAAAPQYAPEAPTLTDAHGFGQTLRWGAGKLGEMAPITAGAVGAGIATGNPILGGAALMAPFEAGDIAQRQDAAPTQAPVGQRLAGALGGGALSALAMNAMPAGLASQLGGHAVEDAVAPGAIRALAGNVAQHGATNYAGMATSEAAKQLATDPSQPLDMGAINDAGVGGAVVGGAFGTLGAASDAMGNGAGKGFKSIKDQLVAKTQAPRDADAAPTADGSTPDTSKPDPSLFDKMSDLAQKASTPTDTTLDDVAQGIPAGVDKAEFAAADPQTAAQMMAQSTKETVAKAAEWANSMLSDSGLTPEFKQQVMDGMKDIQTASGQAAMATLKKVHEAGQMAAGKISDLWDSVSGADDEPTNGDKNSNDYSGAKKVVLQALMDTGLSKSRPDLFQDTVGRDKMADALRSIGEEVPRGPLSSDTIAKAIDVFGDQTMHVISTVTKTLSGSGLDPRNVEMMFKNLKEIADVQKRKGALHELIGASMTDEGKASQAGQDLQSTARDMIDIIRGKNPTNGSPSTQQDLVSGMFGDFMRTHFGSNADLVSRAAEKEAGIKSAHDDTLDESQAPGELNEDGTSTPHDDTSHATPTNGAFDENGNRLEEAPVDEMRFGLSKPDAAGNQKMERDGLAYHKDNRYLAQHKLDLQARYPAETGAQVRFDRLPGSEHGHLVVEDRANPNEFNDSQVDAMRIDNHKFPNSPSKVTIGGQTFDAVGIVREMLKKGNSEFDGQGKKPHLVRVSEAFREGVGRLMERLSAEGKDVNIPDNTVIDRVNGKTITWGEAKYAAGDTAENRMSKSGQAQLKELREAYAKAVKGSRERGEILEEVQALHDRELAKEQTGGQDTTSANSNRDGNNIRGKGEAQLKRPIRDQSDRAKSGRRQRAAQKAGEESEPFEGRDERYDADGNLTKEGARMMLEGDFHGGLDPQEIARRANGVAENDGAPRATGENRVRSYEKGDQGQGRTEMGNDENIHRTAAMNGDEGDAGVGRGASNMDGTPHYISDRGDKNGIAQLNDLANRMNGSTSAVSKNLAAKIRDLNTPEVMARMTPTAKVMGRKVQPGDVHPARAKLLSILAKGTKMSQIAKVVNELHAEYDPAKAEHVEQRVPTAKEKADAKKAAANAKAEAEERAMMDDRERYPDGSAQSVNDQENAAHDMQRPYRVRHVHEVDDDYGQPTAENRYTYHDTKADAQAAANDSSAEFGAHVEENKPDPKAQAAKKAAFLEKAASGDKGLIKELSTSTDAKGLQRAVDALNKVKDKTDGHLSAIDAINKRLGELAQDPDTAYNMLTQKYSLEGTDPNKHATAFDGKSVEDYLRKVLGNSVKLAWDNLSRAGAYSHNIINGIVRLSVHALDPLSTAYHESLHAFFAQLKDAGARDITDVLSKAASTESMIKQLNEIFKNEPAVLKQIANSAEERAAYMYQMWANKKVVVGPHANTILGRIGAFIRKTLGIWSNDERAQHIMNYFHSGEYAKEMGNTNAIRRALMDPGRNSLHESAKALTEPLARMADATLATGGQRLRDTGIKALNDLADAIKRNDTTEGKDQGYVPAARREWTKRMNDLAGKLDGYTQEQLTDAWQSMQTKTAATSPEARLAKRIMQKHLSDTWNYMKSAGVNIGNLGADYAPRVWDTHYIGLHEQEFRNMLEPYVRSGQMKGDPIDFMRNLVNRGGNEFGIETRMPGMQFAKERTMDFLDAKDVAPFLKRDFWGTMNAYTVQAARRAEWNRRLGNGKLEAMFTAAKADGATPEQLNTADLYLKGIDGTLGDSLSPQARRLMGNMMVYQNIRVLPMAAFSLIADPSGVLVRGGTMGDAWNTFKRGVSEMPRSWGKNIKEDAADKRAELMGVVDSAMLSHTMGDLYTQGMVGGGAQKLNTAFFKYNFVEGMNRSFRVGASEAAMKFLATHADGTASKHSARWIKELGLDKSDIKPTADGRIAITQQEGLSAEQEGKIHAAINQWVDGAMLRPDAADRPIWFNDPHFALISHLKQFTYSFQKTIIGRVVHEAQHGNYSPIMSLASYVPIMMASDYVKGMLTTGGGQPEWKDGWTLEDYIENGVQRGGLLGVGQFGFDAFRDVQRGGNGIGSLTGPTVEQLEDVVTALGGHKEFAPLILHAMPANALYSHAFGGDNIPDPKQMD